MINCAALRRAAPLQTRNSLRQWHSQSAQPAIPEAAAAKRKSPEVAEARRRRRDGGPRARAPREEEHPVPGLFAQVPMDPSTIAAMRSPQHYSALPDGAALRVKLPEDQATFVRRLPLGIHPSVLPRKYLPPPLRIKPGQASRKRLDADQVAAMVKQRASDPDFWTVGMLAREFQTTPGVVMRLSGNSPAIQERKRRLAEASEADFARRSVRRTVALLNRERAKWQW